MIPGALQPLVPLLHTAAHVIEVTRIFTSPACPPVRCEPCYCSTGGSATSANLDSVTPIFRLLESSLDECRADRRRELEANLNGFWLGVVVGVALAICLLTLALCSGLLVRRLAVSLRHRNESPENTVSRITELSSVSIGSADPPAVVTPKGKRALLAQ